MIALCDSCGDPLDGTCTLGDVEKSKTYRVCNKCAENPLTAFSRCRECEVTDDEIKALQQFAKDKAAELRGKATS